ncbi:AI-2E family transporter [Halocynthiibacter sp. C4]|uniref:AI-2E family transporter n=1 Tax=Halocynthiibacter sp. C4 TaxID=2992758 RepID=UPI00237A2906|nr:AI-2E family transporter [Halocynthiibacter sp. C4]MDE0589124.1 AI-2E family transporter [Halocynthiibacter sp. C4]
MPKQTRKPKWAEIGIFLCISVFFLEWASDFLIPLVAAFLGSLILRPVQRKAMSVGIPNGITAFLVCLAAGVAIVIAVWTFSNPISQLVNDLPAMINELRNTPNAAAETLDKIGDAAEAAQEAVAGKEDVPAMEVKVVENSSFLGSLVTSAPVLLGQIVLTIVLLFFLVSSGSTFERKLVECMPNFADKRATVQIVQTVAQKLGQYLGGITLINLGLGVVIGLAMAAWGLPNPYMFGVIAFTLNFVPYIGAIFGALLAAIVGFNEFHTAWSAILIFATYMALTSIEGQFVTPYIISNRLKLNPAVVFITVAFFAWIWSVVGMVIAVPLLITAKVLLDQSPSTRPIALFLGEANEQFKKDGGAA